MQTLRTERVAILACTETDAAFIVEPVDYADWLLINATSAFRAASYFCDMGKSHSRP